MRINTLYLRKTEEGLVITKPSFFIHAGALVLILNSQLSILNLILPAQNDAGEGGNGDADRGVGVDVGLE